MSRRAILTYRDAHLQPFAYTSNVMIIGSLRGLSLAALLLAPPSVAQAPQPPPERPVAARGSTSPASVELWDAAMLGDLSRVRAALRAGAAIDAASDSGATALGIAALYGHRPVVEALIAAG